MKSTLLFTLLIIGCSFISFGQNEKAIVLNANAQISDYPTFRKEYNYQYAFPSFELQKRNDKKILSFEIAKISLKINNTEALNIPLPDFPKYKYRDVNISGIIRAQYQHFLKLKHNHWQPYVGGAFSMHYIRNQRIPRVSTDYPQSTIAVGFDQHASLGTYYNLGKYFLQLNTLLGIGTTEIQKTKIQNPALSLEQQRFSTFNINLFPKDYLFRIGIGMKI